MPEKSESTASSLGSTTVSRHKTKRQLNAWDSAFLYMDTPSTPMYGGFLHIYAPVAGESAARRYQRLRWHIEHSLDASPVFRRKIVRSPLDLDHAWFVEGADVDLDYHVRHYALPEPGNDEQLNEVYARIAVQAMDSNRPLWEIHIIDGLNAVEGVPRNGFAMFIKFHHAAVDGRSAAEITAVLHRTNAERNRITRLKPYKAMPAPPAPTFTKALIGTAERYALLSVVVGRKLADRIPTISNALTKRLLRDAVVSDKPIRDKLSVPQTIFNIEINADRCYTHLSLDLDEIRRIRTHVPYSTVNDVYLAVIGGALRTYLREHAALPKKSLIVGVTVDVRDESDRGKGGNHVALIRLPLGTDEADAARRLIRICKNTAQAKAALKRNPEAKSKGQSVSWSRLIPAPLLWLLGGANRLRLTARVKPLVNLGATNVPGPREVLYLDGARMVDFNGAPPFFHGVAMVINTTSYDNALRVSVTACRSVMPDPERMRECLRESFADLRQSFAGKANKPERTTKPKTRPKMPQKTAQVKNGTRR